jgi:cytochrome c-type biogenesis protein CcmF
MPWIVGTALLHSLLVTEKRNTFKAWTALLAIVAFLLSLLGTFLVRSGILTSVHSFAVDPQRGLFMLIFLLVVMCISSVLYASRAMYFRSNESFSLLSRETFLMLNNVMLAAIMCTILLGTLYPLGMQALHLEKLSVGAPYFNTVFSLLMLPILFIMGLGPLTFWRAMPIENLMEKIRLAFLLCLVLGLLIPWLMFNTFHPGAALGIFLAIWITVTTLLSQRNKRHWGMLFAHIGIAVCLAGIVVSTSYSVERNVVMALGDTVKLSHYTLLFKSIKNITGPNYEGLEGVFILQSKGKNIGVIHPEKRYYPIQQTVMTDAAIDANLFRDIYVALGEKVQQNHHDAWIIRMYYKPLIRWIWGGGFLILLGGIFAGIKQARKNLSHSMVGS